MIDDNVLIWFPQLQLLCDNSYFGLVFSFYKVTLVLPVMIVAKTALVISTRALGCNQQNFCIMVAVLLLALNFAMKQLPTMALKSWQPLSVVYISVQLYKTKHS